MTFDHRFRNFLVGIGLAGSVSTASAYTAPAAALTALDKLRSYSELTTAAGSMDLDIYTHNLTTWQMTHGGFSKAHAALYVSPYDGTSELSSWTGTAGDPLGMYDNNATVQEMRLLAVRYAATTNSTYKKEFRASFHKALSFVLNSQLPNGGWPQVYPKRGNYSDMATYNDGAMIRVMVMVKDLVDKKSPFNTDITTADTLSKLSTALTKAVDFAVKAQIVNSGKPTVWCAQHDPSTYAPAPARAYELASKSGSESIGVTYFLMAWPDQTTAIQSAVKGSIAWYKKTKVSDLQFSSGVFTTVAGKSLWYRFYDVTTDSQFFCDRDGIKTRDFSTLSLERQTGYQWAGDYGSTLIGMEAAYLAALAATGVSPASPTPARAGIRSLGGILSAPVPADGLYDVVFLDARGAVRSRVQVQASNGELRTAIPASLRRGLGTVRIAKPGQAPIAQGTLVGF